MNDKIIQIIPAPADLLAVYENDDKETSCTGRLAALALMESADGFRYATGLCAGDGIVPVEEIDNFMCFMFDE